MGLDAQDTLPLLHAVGEMFLPADTPERLRVDDRKKKPASDWLSWGDACKRTMFAQWANGVFLRYDRDIIVKVGIPSFSLDPDSVVKSLANLPFEVASFAPVYPEWLDNEYIGPSFAELHWSHGWGCAFRGAGHRHLVSRRWLEHGPWRLLRGADDTSLIQFHDIEAGAETALEQARPGHERMGISDFGGYIGPGYDVTHDLKGLYVPEQRQLRIVVHGREVPQSEMTDACAARTRQPLGADRQINSVAYVFMEKSNAEAHLHELWLREIECRAIVDGVEQRLDQGYAPGRVVPKWTKELE